MASSMPQHRWPIKLKNVLISNISKEKLEDHFKFFVWGKLYKKYGNWD